MIHYLKLHGRNVDYHEIFPPKMKNRVQVYYNQYRSLLLAHPISRLALETFLSDVIVFIYGEQVFSYKYFIDETDKHGNVYRRIVTKISKHPPFCQMDAVEVRLLPTLEEMNKLLTKLAKNDKYDKLADKIMALISKINENITLEQALEQYQLVFGTEWEYEPCCTKKAFMQMMKKRKLTEYAEINFRPYAGSKCPLPKTILNTFEGFPLEHYIPNKHIKIEDTLIYEYLCRVFGHSDTMTPRLSELLDRVAFKLLYPSIRTGRIHAISSIEQGVGKSAFYKFLSMVFSHKYCVFHDNIDTYLSKFNWHLHSKLIHFIDDLDACGKVQSRKLYSKVTTDHILTEKKGENIIRMDEFSELWITGNQNSCSLHVCAEDRRILIYKASDVLIGNYKFWNDLHKDFENLDIAKAWYDHLKQRPVQDFNYRTNSVNSATAKLQSITDCMPKSHLYIHKVFGTEEFVERLGSWNKIQMFEKSKKPVLIRVDEESLYEDYKQYVKRYYSSSTHRHINTFRREIQLIGAVFPDKRQKLHTKNRHVVHFEFKPYQTSFEKRYKGAKVEEWFMLTHYEIAKKYINV
jgi:hypothetical protein